MGLTGMGYVEIHFWMGKLELSLYIQFWSLETYVSKFEANSAKSGPEAAKSRLDEWGWLAMDILNFTLEWEN